MSEITYPALPERIARFAYELSTSRQWHELDSVRQADLIKRASAEVFPKMIFGHSYCIGEPGYDIWHTQENDDGDTEIAEYADLGEAISVAEALVAAGAGDPENWPEAEIREMITTPIIRISRRTVVETALLPVGVPRDMLEGDL